MELDYFTPRLLTGIINLRPIKYDLFGSFFRRASPKPVDVLELQTSLRGTSVLPAITNVAPGTMREHDSWDVSFVKAPRFRPKRGFRAADMLKTQKGHTPYDPLVNPVEQAIAEDMDAHRDDIDRMIEIMCAQATVDGKIELYDMIDGVATPTYTVDFKRPATHSITLDAADYWTAETSYILDQVEEWDLLIQEDTGGLASTDLILGKHAWTAFFRHPDVFQVLDNRRVDIGAITPRVGAKFKGYWNGLNIWVSNGTYKDISGTIKHFLDPDCVVLLARDAESVIEYAQPIDIDCTGPTQYFSKQFKQDDPSGIFTLAESRPLPITRHIGWTVKAKVVDSTAGAGGQSGVGGGSDTGLEDDGQ